MFFRISFIILLFLAATAYGTEQAGETTPESILEEVVVSGYRLSTPFEQDADLTLFDHATIEATTVENFEELAQLVPNMNLSGEGSRARYFQLRGVGEREQDEGAPNSSVGYIIEDIDLSGIGGVVSTFDLDQVEILRGPQSAGCGSSALASIVYLRSVDPGPRASFTAGSTVGHDGLFSVSVAAGGPLGDQFSGRTSTHQAQSNGFRNSHYLGIDDTNERDELTIRGKLKWSIGDDWEALLSGLYVDYE